MQFSGLRSWERVPAWIPFSNSLQWLFSASAILYVLDYLFCCNWYNFILCNNWVVILLKIHKPAFLLIKYTCYTRDLGPPCPSFWLHSHQNVEIYEVHFLARAFKTSLRGHPVPLWAVQVLCMGFIGFPRNPRDTALSLSFRQLRSTRSQSVKKTNKWPPKQGLGIHGIQDRGTGTYWGQVSVRLWNKQLESPTIFLLYFIIY